MCSVSFQLETPAREFVADLHLHSRYAYACSKNLTLANIVAAAKIKGIDLLATADFTHPAWLSELEANLIPVDIGAFQFQGVNFVLGTEVSCVYKQVGKGRRLHLLLFLTSFNSVARFNTALRKRGSKLDSDGRPSVGMAAPDLTSMLLDIDPQAMVIPAHVWTPWYGLLGFKSGFDSLEECFGGLTPMVRAVETGLSSDPAMNWAVPEISDRTIVSFSDVHSLPNLGREVTVFRQTPTYLGLKDALEQNRIAYTVEFYPEEGKYHYNGHRSCGVSQSPQETLDSGDKCPVCARPMTLGVLHRVRSLAGEASEEMPGPDGFIRARDGRPPFLRLVQLEELLAETLGAGRQSKTVQKVHEKLCNELGNELTVLSKSDLSDLEQVAGERVAQAIMKARTGRVSLESGFDGQYGRVQV